MPDFEQWQLSVRLLWRWRERPSRFVRTLPDGFTRPLGHELNTGVGSTTGLNSRFNTTVTLLAAVG